MGVYRDFESPKGTPPRPYDSWLEVRVAEFLDECGVAYEPQAPVEGARFYRPDFTIHGADEKWELPRWIEVKPSTMLYQLRDHFGLNETLDGEPQFLWHDQASDWRSLRAASVEELWKPKRLAEETGSRVLVVSAVNRLSILSVEMNPCGIEFTKWHPFANWKGRVKAEERRRREAEWRERDERAAQAWAEHRARLESEREALVRGARLAMAQGPGRPAKYPGQCTLCGQYQLPEELLMWRLQGQWVVACEPCRSASQ